MRPGAYNRSYDWLRTEVCGVGVCLEGKDGVVVSMVRLVAKGTRLQEPWVWQLGTFATGSERLTATVDMRP